MSWDTTTCCLTCARQYFIVTTLVVHGCASWCWPAPSHPFVVWADWGPRLSVVVVLDITHTSASSPSPTSSLSPVSVLCLFEPVPSTSALGPSDHSALLSGSISGRVNNLSHISLLESSMMTTVLPLLPPFIACDPIPYVGPPTEKIYSLKLSTGCCFVRRQLPTNSSLIGVPPTESHFLLVVPTESCFC